MKKVLKVIGIIFGIIVVIGILIFILLKNTFLMSHPELKGEPEENKWYRITPKDAKSSDGSDWHGIFKLGKEKNKVIVYFFVEELVLLQKHQKVVKNFMLQI